MINNETDSDASARFRVLHVIHGVDRNSGGPSMSLRQLLSAQQRAGIETALVSTRLQSALVWERDSDYVSNAKRETCFRDASIFLAHAWGKKPPWSVFGWTPEGARQIRKICCGRTRPDVVHIHGVFSHITESAASIARNCGIPYVIRPAGALDPTCLGKGRSLWKSAFIHCSLRRTIQRAAFVHAMSTMESEGVRELVPSARVEIIPHGVGVDHRSDGVPVRPTVSAFLNGRRYILCLSRLDSIKRLDMAIDALSRLARTNLALILAGNDGGAREELEREACRLGVRERVLFPGFVEGQEKTSLLQNAAVFLQCSEHENFGISVIEAMSCGTLVVATNRVAASQYVSEAGCGLVVASTPSAIAEGIAWAAERPELGAKGKSFARTNFTWNAVVARLNHFYALAGEAHNLEQSPKSQ